MKDMMAKLQDAQSQAKEMKKRLALVEVREGNAELSVVLNANREIKDIQINDSSLQDAEELGDKLVITLNKALEKASAIHEKEMQSMAQGMLPGMDMFK